MLISDSHKFIFVHIRKAAGSSIRDTLSPISLVVCKSKLAKIKSRLLHVETNYHRFAFRAHSPVIHAKNTMPEALYESYFKFAFVRSPFTRLVSEYEFIRRRSHHGRYKKVSKMSFHQYINYQAKRYDAHQINMLTDKNGNLQMDFIGKFETLHQDWDFACNKLGITNAALKHLNKASQVNYGDYYNKENIDLVSKLWKRDIEAFGYSYEMEK